MTFTFKLARRLAQSHIAILALGFLTGSCAPGQPIEGGLEPPPDDVLAIHLIPDSVSLNPAEFVDFTAIAELSSGENSKVGVTWVAQGGTISSAGRYTAGSTAGVYQVIGQYQNGPADTATVVVTVVTPPPPVLTRIDVTPGTVALLPSATQQFAAAGVMSDGSGSSVSVTWTTTGGIIDANGLYTAPSVAGTYRVVASQVGGSLSDTAQVTVTIPPPTLTAVILTPPSTALQFGQTQQFSAQGQLSDGSLTSIAVTWTSTGGTINSSGLYTAGSTAGTFRSIARSANGLADTSAVTISAPSITSISLTPASVSLQSGQTQQFSVSASLSNGGTQSNPSVTWVATGGSINASGLYTAGATAGTFRVIATSTNGKADTSAVTVSLPTITAIIVTPASVTLGAAQTQQFTASATLSNGGTQANPSVTWSATGGTISTGGLYTAGSTAGAFRVIGVSSNGRADTSTVTITAATITAITLTPATVSLQVGQTQQFSVSASMSDGSTQPNPTVTYNATGGTVNAAGLYTAGATAGTFRLIASASGKADTSAITITAATITAVSITPVSVNLATGATQQFVASATLSTGGTQNNPTLTWTATGGTVSSSGLYTAGASAGSFRVIGTAASGVADTSSITLTAPTVTAIVVTPATATVTVSTTQQFTASATLSTGGTQSNPAVTWSATGGTINASGLYTAGSTAGTFQVIAVQQSGTLADTSTVTVAPVGTGLYPNKPANYTNSSELNFSQAIPSQPDNVDRPIPGAPSGWNMIYFGSNWSKISDPTASQSAPDVWQGHWAAGSYGGGVLGQGSGHGIGNVFTYAANGTSRLYMSMRVYFDFDASQWHPISNKFVNIEGNNSLILMQLAEGGNWRHAEELANGGASFWVDNNVQAGEVHLPGQLSNPAIPVRQWVQFEVLVDIPNHVFKIWQNGVLTTSATPNFNSTVMTTVGWNAFRGGGGETLSADLNYRYDHFYIAW